MLLALVGAVASARNALPESRTRSEQHNFQQNKFCVCAVRVSPSSNALRQVLPWTDWPSARHARVSHRWPATALGASQFQSTHVIVRLPIFGERMRLNFAFSWTGRSPRMSSVVKSANSYTPSGICFRLSSERKTENTQWRTHLHAVDATWRFGSCYRSFASNLFSSTSCRCTVNLSTYTPASLHHSYPLFSTGSHASCDIRFLVNNRVSVIRLFYCVLTFRSWTKPNSKVLSWHERLCPFLLLVGGPWTPNFCGVCG